MLASIRYLAAVDRLYEVRLLLLPGINDDPALLDRTARWLADIDPAMRVKLIGFREHGVRPSSRRLVEPTADQMAAYEDVFKTTRRVQPLRRVSASGERDQFEPVVVEVVDLRRRASAAPWSGAAARRTRCRG